MSKHKEDKHNPDLSPVEGCPECDEYIKRPIQLCHGDGSSTIVVQLFKPTVDEQE